MKNFYDVVKTKTSSCKKCFSMIYSLPCIIDRNLAIFLKEFGEPIYPLDRVRLIKISTSDGFHIEARIDTKTLKFVMPKKYEQIYPAKIEKKDQFEKALAKWLTNKLSIEIVF